MEANMLLDKTGIAGTLESSDAQVTVEPNMKGTEINIVSSVINQFGRQIRNTVAETLQRLGVDDVRVTVVDKGALDCTLKARVECACYRAAGITDQYPWGGTIQ